MTYTLYVNGSATSITCQVSNSATTCDHTAHTATITTAQTAYLQVASSTSATASRENFGIEFDNP